MTSTRNEYLHHVSGIALGTTANILSGTRGVSMKIADEMIKVTKMLDLWGGSWRS